MVKQGDPLSATFGALADPTRRGILEQLSEGEANVTALAEPYDISLPAVSRHLRVLEGAGLIVRKRRGRQHRIHVDPRRIRDARDWISVYARYWERQFDALDRYLEKAQSEAEGTPTKEDGR